MIIGQIVFKVSFNIRKSKIFFEVFCAVLPCSRGRESHYGNDYTSLYTVSPLLGLSCWQPKCFVAFWGRGHTTAQWWGTWYTLWIVIWEDECHLIFSATENSTQQALAYEHVLLWKDARDSSGETKGWLLRKQKECSVSKKNELSRKMNHKQCRANWWPATRLPSRAACAWPWSCHMEPETTECPYNMQMG